MPTLDKVALDIQVVLGTTTMPVHQVLRLGRGAIIELDASEDDEVAILANNFPVAKGTVVVSGNRIAVEVKELVPAARRSESALSQQSIWPRPGIAGRADHCTAAALVPRGLICYIALDAGHACSRSPHMRSWRNW